MQKLLFTLHVQKLLKKSNSVDSVLTKWISMSNKNKPTLVLNLTRRNWLGYTIINSCKSQSVLVLKCLFHLLTEWKATSRILLVLYWRKNYQDLYKAGTKNGILKDLFIPWQEIRFNLLRSKFLLLKKLKKIWLQLELQTESRICEM